MHEAVWTDEAAARYTALKHAAEGAAKARRRSGRKKPTKAEGLFKQVHKCVTHLLADPRHPGLQTHAYRSLPHPWDKRGKVFEAYVHNRTPGAYRLFWCYAPGKKQLTSSPSHPIHDTGRTGRADACQMQQGATGMPIAPC